MGAPRREHRQCNRREHEKNSRPSGGLGQDVSSGAGSESGLAAHAAKRSRNVSTLTVLKQHNDDEEGTDQDVDGGDQTNEHVILSSFFRWCVWARRICPQLAMYPLLAEN